MVHMSFKWHCVHARLYIAGKFKDIKFLFFSTGFIISVYLLLILSYLLLLDSVSQKKKKKKNTDIKNISHLFNFASCQNEPQRA